MYISSVEIECWTSLLEDMFLDWGIWKVFIEWWSLSFDFDRWEGILSRFNFWGIKYLYYLFFIFVLCRY